MARTAHAAPRSPEVVWNRLAHRRDELFSRELAPERHAYWWARRHDGEPGRLNRWIDRLRDTTLENVPYVDPTAAGDGARVLLLGAEPAADAEDGCGFASRYANDAVSANLYRAADRATLARAPHPNPLVHDRLDPVTGRRNGDRLVEVLRDAGRRARGEDVGPPRVSRAGRRPF